MDIDGLQAFLTEAGSTGILGGILFWFIRSAFPSLLASFKETLETQREEFSESLREEREAHRDVVKSVEARWERQTDRVEGAIDRNTQILEEVRDRLGKADR
tara:strand:- start:663 stop:968 length:306 start_codon:yes stop_codon:yes gene_type:complete